MRIGRRLTEDLTTYGRIRNAALRSFAERGVAGTSIRDVAHAARVSPGLLQHHFRTKDGLRSAVDAYVLTRAAEALADAAADDRSQQVAIRYGSRIEEFIRSNPELVAYLRRALLESDAIALRLFADGIKLIRSHLKRLASKGILHPDLDLTWATLHLLLLNVGPVLLETVIDRHLDAPLLSERGLVRWRDATVALVAKGMYRSGQALPGRKQRARR